MIAKQLRRERTAEVWARWASRQLRNVLTQWRQVAHEQHVMRKVGSCQGAFGTVCQRHDAIMLLSPSTCCAVDNMVVSDLGQIRMPVCPCVCC